MREKKERKIGGRGKRRLNGWRPWSELREPLLLISRRRRRRRLALIVGRWESSQG
jgi:hypothetical protein